MKNYIKLYSVLILGTLIVSGCSNVRSLKGPVKQEPKAVQPAKVATTQKAPMQRGPIQATPIASQGGSVQDYDCPSNQYSGLVGKKYQDIPKSQLPPYFRTLKPGQSLSMNQNMRVNLYLDGLGQVTRITCG